MNSTNYENQILNAIETVVNNAVNNAGYDKTIQAVILENIDSSIGKYKVKYQDSELEVFSNNPDIIYPIGTMVNILVPGNDFSQSKTIIDAVEKKDVQYTTVLEDYEKYEDTSGNVITSNQEFGLCSYKVDGDKIILYDRNREINDIDINITNFKENLENSDSILLGASFKNNLYISQKVPGNFGYVIEMEFKDNISGDIITKLYQLDVNQMSGSPYELTTFTRQYKIFEIETENFVDIKQIYIFAKDFPNSSEEITTKDIFVKNFELNLFSALSDEELKEYVIYISKGSKTYFNPYDDENATIQLFAEVKFKNKTVNTDINYYWFKENNGVDVSSSDYNHFGGKGWTCLNNYTLIGGQMQSKMYIPTINTISIVKSDAPNAILNVKCVAVRNDKILAEKIISISNYAADINLTIESDEGTLFYYDIGSPTLTCKTNSAWDEDENNNLTYKWSMIDNNGIYTILDETKEINQIYNAAVINYEALQAKIATGTAMAAASQAELDSYLAIINEYKNTQRVEGRYVYHVNIPQIKNTATFKCSVWNNDELLGTASITLKNMLITEGEYFLNIINGDQTYIYNAMGTSPTNQSLEKNVEIQPLSFEITDNLGGKLNKLVLNNCIVNWEVPKNSLIIAEDSQDLLLPYTIADNYDLSKINNNTINLTVKYKNLVLKAKTTFNFIKEGEPGTNGSEVICKIVPNTTDEDFKDYPMLINGTPNYSIAVAKKWFRVQLWKSGNKIWEGYQSDAIAGIDLTWSILKNKYTNEIENSSSINIDNNGDFTYNGTYNNADANIVKAEIKYLGQKYYATLPLICANYDINEYQIKLVEGTGFRYVLYTSDGRSPQYDNMHPFTLEVKRKINGYWENVSTIENQYQVIYNWSSSGSIYNGTTWINKEYLTKENDLTGNSKFFIPNEEYDGECINNTIHANLQDSNLINIGSIHIPVHLYLYKYGIAALNDWDGNKITLNDELGAILAPQVGAGKKNNANQFTGVLMGSVKESGRDNAEEGLFGYHNGQRTIFLDANTGKAEFGKAGAGQIILDPTNNTAKIQSGNYVPGTSGMLIDFTTPEIKFGSGKFSVNNNGVLNATEANISGAITATSLTLAEGVTVPANKVDGLNNAIDDEVEALGVLYQGDIQHTRTTSSDGHLITDTVTFKDINGVEQTYITYTSTSDGYVYTNVGIGTQDTSTHANNYVKINKNGLLEADNALIHGTIYAGAGQIGGWTLSNSALYTANNNLYLGTVGLDNIVIGNESHNSIVFKAGDNFGVNSAGNLFAANANIKGTITAENGKIGGWTIDATRIYVDNKTGMSSDPAKYAFWAGETNSKNGTSETNAKFKVSHNGGLYASSAEITGTINAKTGTFGDGTNKINIGTNNTSNSSIYSGSKSSFNSANNGFYIGTDGIALGAYDSTLGNPFQVTTAGALTARSGKIGGYTIDEWRLYGSQVGMCSEPDHTDWAFWAGAEQGSSASAPFRVGHDGAIFSRMGTIGGFTITGSSLYNKKNSRTSNTQGIYVGTDGISLGNSTYYFRMGVSTKHPQVSGLNVDGSNGEIKIRSDLSDNNGGILINGNTRIIQRASTTNSITLTAGTGIYLNTYTFNFGNDIGQIIVKGNQAANDISININGTAYKIRHGLICNT